MSRLPVKDLLQDLLKRANTDPDPKSHGPRGADADRANLEIAPEVPLFQVNRSLYNIAPRSERLRTPRGSVSLSGTRCPGERIARNVGRTLQPRNDRRKLVARLAQCTRVVRQRFARSPDADSFSV